jgi:hypothetical protein
MTTRFQLPVISIMIAAFVLPPYIHNHEDMGFLPQKLRFAGKMVAAGYHENFPSRTKR